MIDVCKSSGDVMESLERSGGAAAAAVEDDSGLGVEEPEPEDVSRYVNWRETRKWISEGIDGIPASR